LGALGCVRYKVYDRLVLCAKRKCLQEMKYCFSALNGVQIRWNLQQGSNEHAYEHMECGQKTSRRAKHSTLINIMKGQGVYITLCD